MSIKSSAYKIAIKLICDFVKSIFTLLPSNRRDQALVDLSNGLSLRKSVDLDSGKKLYFHCPSHDTVYRAVEFLKKEPETLSWIDSFSGNDLLWDIGANIGSYSLYAAKNKNLQVFAFEPSFSNFCFLNENIKLNNLGDKITAYCIALAREPFLGTFNMGDTVAGGAHYHFGSAVDSFQYPGIGETKVQFKQGMLGLSIDDLISQYKLNFPQHIKIDVDGIEADIIQGAKNTLKDLRLKSVLIEIDESDAGSKSILSAMENAGFTFQTYDSFEIKYPFIRNYIFSRRH